jgi:hypothetical protein
VLELFAKGSTTTGEVGNTFTGLTSATARKGAELPKECVPGPARYLRDVVAEKPAAVG